MNEYLHIATEGLVILTAVGVAGRWVLVKYLQDSFASKADVARIELKIDSLTELHWGKTDRRRPR